MRTVKQAAGLSGVSVRTLHHYDHIGLLKPYVGDNGYRYYGPLELQRLQHILLYRNLGLPLAEIARILDDPGFDTRTALLDLRRRVADEIAHRQRLATAIDQTMASLDADSSKLENRFFHSIGLDPAKPQETDVPDRPEDGAAALTDNPSSGGATRTALGISDQPSLQMASADPGRGGDGETWPHLPSEVAASCLAPHTLDSSDLLADPCPRDPFDAVRYGMIASFLLWCLVVLLLWSMFVSIFR